MEGPLTHLFHSLVITVVLFLVMKFALNQSQTMALNRSLIGGAVALIYMILFGHGLPTRINRV